MELTPEQVEAMFAAEQPDMKICLHEFRIAPTKALTDDGGHGFIARMLAHDADGKTVTLDFVTTEPVLQDIIEQCAQAGLAAALAAAMILAAAGDTDALVNVLASMVIDVDNT